MKNFDNVHAKYDVKYMIGKDISKLEKLGEDYKKLSLVEKNNYLVKGLSSNQAQSTQKLMD